MNLEQVEPVMQNFFIFNSSFGQIEGKEQEKLLYYYPEKHEMTTQIRNVSLVEAIVKFSSTFNATKDCQSLHTQKVHQAYFKAENNIWFAMSISVAWTEREKDSGSVREYQSESLQDQILYKELIRAYSLFKFSFNTIQSHLEVDFEPYIETKLMLKRFFDEYISERDVVHGNILNVWDGVSFLQVDRLCFLKIHSLVSTLVATFDSIAHTTFLYKGSFMWTSFDLETFRCASKYILKRLKSSKIASVSVQSSRSSNSSRESSTSDRITFLGESPHPYEKIFIKAENGELALHFMALFMVNEAVMCITFKSNEFLTPALFENLKKLLESRMLELISVIESQNLSKNEIKNEDFKFVYHNYCDLATKCSKKGAIDISCDTNKTLVDLHEDLKNHECDEIVAKTASDFWVTARSGNGRESFIILSQKNANLSEISSDVDKINDNFFSSIFMVK